MRLYDRIMAGQWQFLPQTYESGSPEELDTLAAGLVKSMHEAARFDIQNVADYYFNGTPQEEWEWSKDFPNMAPPFEKFWVEYTLPRTYRTSHGVEQFNDIPGYTIQAVGVLVIATENDEGWQVSGYSFLLDEGAVYGPVQIAMISVDGQGAVRETPKVALLYRVAENDQEFGLQAFHPMALAISFMHCKNVMIEGAPDTRTRQQRRYDERKGTKPTEFKTLVIEPMKRVLKTEGGIEQHGLKKAMHICRGHFAVYTEEKPLFGRIVGPVWRQAHVRGSAEAGMVGKDYKVTAPNV